MIIYRLKLSLPYYFGLLLLIGRTSTTTQAYQPLFGVKVAPLKDPSSKSVDIGEWLSSSPSSSEKKKCMVIFGTYAADFNAIEYGQRLRYYWPKLRDENQFEKCALLLNCQPSAAQKLLELVDLPSDIEVWVDNTGEAGRTFGVERGWLPDDEETNPFLKLFGMLFGLGAWATLPAVIGGYIGNPFVPQPWIEDALAVGQRQGRWPDNALELSSDETTIKSNKFAELPVVGVWQRRPLELATLRLQSMLGISLKNWNELAPDEEALNAGVLTQLGGCLVVDTKTSETIFEWRDPGICAVANFESLLKKLDKLESGAKAEISSTPKVEKPSSASAEETTSSSSTSSDGENSSNTMDEEEIAVA